jgi:Uma2 family endonuclease
MAVLENKQQLPEQAIPPEAYPDVEQLVTEDETPVDNIFSEKQQRLLTGPLYSSWTGPGGGRPFMALANVGLFYAIKEPPLVPDMLLSLDAEMPADPKPKESRSYFVWLYGKPPDVVIEVVSNREGGEATEKLALYARIRIPYYVIFDPFQELGGQVLKVLRLQVDRYEPLEEPYWLPHVGLGMKLWEGRYEGVESKWLRWVDAGGNPILTGAERAEQEHQRAEQEHQRAEQERQRAEQECQRAEQERQRAEQERQRAEQERQRAERLAQQLRKLGVEPEA